MLMRACRCIKQITIEAGDTTTICRLTAAPADRTRAMTIRPENMREATARHRRRELGAHRIKVAASPMLQLTRYQ
jgi:hypothetical protein